MSDSQRLPNQPQNCVVSRGCGACTHLGLPVGAFYEEEQAYLIKVLTKETEVQGALLKPSRARMSLNATGCPWGFGERLRRSAPGFILSPELLLSLGWKERSWRYRVEPG